MKRIVVLMSAAALAGCGNVESKDSGCVADAECGEGETCNPETAKCEALPDGLAIQLLPTTFYDERGDHIAFSTGEPVHTHAGEAVTLGGADCPAVYKYSYLLGPVAPPYGEEVTPNPIAWKFRALGGAVAQAEFRVRSADATEVDWTPATPGDDGIFGVEIHRSGRNGLPNLELATKQYFVDFRVRDDHKEIIRSACWEHHALAPPVSFSGLVANTDSDALLQLRLAADSRVSDLMLTGSGVKVMQARITHQTAEPVSIRIDIPTPTVTFTEKVVVDWFNQGDIEETFPCETTCMPNSPACVPQPATDPRCASFPGPPTDPDPTFTGVLGQGRWSIAVFDGQTMQPASDCTVSDTSIDCALTSRMDGSPAKELVIVTRASELTELDPDPTKSMWEFKYLDLNYTGHHITDYAPSVFCMSKRYEYEPNGSLPHRCEKYRTYRKLVMIDGLRLDVSAPAMTVTTGIAPTTRIAPHYLVDGEVKGASFAWDSGDDDLPGPH
jgi:hypothetical protein